MLSGLRSRQHKHLITLTRTSKFIDYEFKTKSLEGDIYIYKSKDIFRLL